jgi:membrane protein
MLICTKVFTLSLDITSKYETKISIEARLENTHNYSIFKRISTLILVILCVVIGINLYLMHNKNAANWYQLESEQLGRSLTFQAAKLVAAPLAKDDQELLGHYVEVINQGMFVKGAVMFDAVGVRYAQQEERLSVIDMLRLQDVEPLVFVEDIVFEDEIIGYIKLVLDKKAITQHHRTFNQNQLSQSILVIILSFIVAVLGTRLFYKVRRSYRLADDEETLV